MAQNVAAFMENVIAKNPAEMEFHQAVEEVVESIWPVLEKRPEYRKAKILERSRRARARDPVPGSLG